jgi:hypothetical protein
VLLNFLDHPMILGPWSRRLSCKLAEADRRMAHESGVLRGRRQTINGRSMDRRDNAMLLCNN